MLHDTHNDCIHRANAHQGGQLKQSHFAMTGTHRLERLIAEVVCIGWERQARHRRFLSVEGWLSIFRRVANLGEAQSCLQTVRCDQWYRWDCSRRRRAGNAQAPPPGTLPTMVMALAL
ncbi:MAG: hypothetical protein ACI8W7_002190 [Gammaproteobacteria bacterium]